MQGSSKNHRFASESDLWLRSVENSNDDVTAAGYESDATVNSNQR